jgi:hypothetical protein
LMKDLLRDPTKEGSCRRLQEIVSQAGRLG